MGQGIRAILLLGKVILRSRCDPHRAQNAAKRHDVEADGL